jgi:hypothetical protein
LTAVVLERSSIERGPVEPGPQRLVDQTQSGARPPGAPENPLP